MKASISEIRDRVAKLESEADALLARAERASSPAERRDLENRAQSAWEWADALYAEHLWARDLGLG